MGEVAEMMLNGIVCQICGEYLGDDIGYPRTCKICLTEGYDDSDSEINNE